jgi:phage protein D
MTFVVNIAFHVFKSKSFNENKRRSDRKQTYHANFNFIKHKLAREVECILGVKQTKHLVHSSLNYASTQFYYDVGICYLFIIDILIVFKCNM